MTAVRSDFSEADFRGAKLWDVCAWHAKFDRAVFRDARYDRISEYPFSVAQTDLRYGNFVNCDLDYADFGKSILDGMFFVDCNLTGALLNTASLAGTSFTDSDVWTARLLNGTGSDAYFASKNPFEFEMVKSLRDLADLRQHLQDVYEDDVHFGRVKFYFRGELCARWSLRSTVARQKLRLFENDLLTDLKTESPATFAGRDYAIDELAIARHFGLPTRLLDVTRNPLVGAFWATETHKGSAPQPRACQSEDVDGPPRCECADTGNEPDGRLHVFAIPRPMVCAYDSDRVSVVANFARLPWIKQQVLLSKRLGRDEFDELGGYDTVADWPSFGLGESMTTLLHNIRREKPYFADRIDVRDLFRVFVVEPRRSFDRVRAQSGAFLLSAFHERFEGAEVAKSLAGTRLYDHHVVTVPADKKEEIRDELDWFGINAQTLMADMDSAADAVGSRFRKLAEWLGVVHE